MDLSDYTFHGSDEIIIPKGQFIELMYVNNGGNNIRFHVAYGNYTTAKKYTHETSIDINDNSKATLALLSTKFGLKKIDIDDEIYVPCSTFSRVNTNLKNYDVKLLPFYTHQSTYIKYGDAEKYQIEYYTGNPFFLFNANITKYLIITCFDPKMDVQLGQLYINDVNMEYTILSINEVNTFESKCIYLIEMGNATKIDSYEITDFDDHELCFTFLC